MGMVEIEAGLDLDLMWHISKKLTLILDLRDCYVGKIPFRRFLLAVDYQRQSLTTYGTLYIYVGLK